MLEVKDLSFTYRKEEVLSHISFQLHPGKITVLLGPNGTGKSTLINVLTGLLKTEKGKIFYDGKDLRDLSYKEKAKIIGYVSQRMHPSSLSVYDTILLGRINYFGRKESEEDHRIVEEIIHELKLVKFALRPCDELSGGELQLVMIAKALAQDATYLLLDEPTSSLDIKKQLLILGLVKELCKKKKLTVLVSLHDINLALQYADYLIMIKDKSIVFHDEIALVTESILKQTYEINLQLIKEKEKGYIKYEQIQND